MSYSWTGLISAPTASEAFSRLISLAKAVGFPVTSWATKSVARVILHLVSQASEQFGSIVTGLAKSAFRSTAQGQWLDLLAEEVFGISRNLATNAVVTATLHNSGGSPVTVGASDLYLSAGGLLFRNTVGGTVPAGGSLDLTWRAEHPGTSYNLDSSALEGLVTPLAGITITASSGWLTTQAVDDETDASLATRCGEQWSTLGASGSAPAYAYNAKLASSEVTRTRVYEHTPSAGWVTLYLAGPAGPVTLTTANTVKAWIETQGRRPMCVGLVVDPAGTHTITVTGTVKVKAGLVPTARAAVAAAFAELQSNTDFGGVVDQAAIIAAVRTARGVVHLALSTPAADVTLAASELAVLVDSLTYIEV